MGPAKKPKKKRAPRPPKEVAVELTVAERAAALLRKEFGGAGGENSAASTLALGGRSRVRSVMPTGLSVLDHHVIGIGGLPYGRIVEVYGPESVGKSALEWHLMGAAQRDGALVVFGESEPALAPEWVDTFGVSRKDVVTPDCDVLEVFLREVECLLDKLRGKQKLVVFLDSVDSCLPEDAVKAHARDKDVPGIMGRAWSEWMRVLAPKVSEKQAILVLVNQVRAKIGNMYGPQETTPGGNAIKFYSSIRLAMSHGQFEKRGTARVGKWARVRAIKNKCTVPMRDAEVLLRFGEGFDDAASTMDFAKEAGCVGRDCTSLREARLALGWPVDEAAPDVKVAIRQKKEGS